MRRDDPTVLMEQPHPGVLPARVAVFEARGEHLWTIVTVVELTPEDLANALAIATPENLLAMHIICAVCELTYDETDGPNCPGQPSEIKP